MKFLFLAIAIFPWVIDALPAFPGAEGWGGSSKGGRSGAIINNKTYNSRVIHVTNLNASGPGSLAAALNIGGPRFVVFDVSGVIDLQNRPISVFSYVTVAGQTSPGGITLINGFLMNAQGDGANIYTPSWNCTQEVIIRHLRVRSSVWMGGADCIRFMYSRNVIIDHCSFTNPCDENMDLNYSQNITVSRCILADGNRGCFAEPNPKAILVGSGHHQSCLRTLFAHFNKRIPMYSNCYNGCGITLTHFEVVNNVLYNCGNAETFPNNNNAYLNVVGNYLKAGPDNRQSAAWTGSGNVMYLYSGGNYNPSFPSQGQNAFVAGNYTSLTAPAYPQYQNPLTAQQAYDLALSTAGALPRDSTDRRVLREVATATGQLRVLSAEEISTQKLIPREPLALPSWERPVDTDNDGIPDRWETLHGLNPADSSDFRTERNGGYEAIEAYINELSDTLEVTGRFPAYISAEKSSSGIGNVSFSAAPNPFNSNTRMVFTGVLQPDNVVLQILDVNGRTVENIPNGSLDIKNGSVRHTWSPGNLPPGIYFARLNGQSGSMIAPLLRIK